MGKEGTQQNGSKEKEIDDITQELIPDRWYRHNRRASVGWVEIEMKLLIT